jgi:general secretion pathway protein K
MNQNGIALIFSLVVVALLSILVIEFSFLSRVNASIVGNWESERRAYYLAKGGVSFGVYLLKRDKPGVDCYLDDWAKAIPPIPVDEGVITFEVSDEDGKINVNSLIGKNGKLNRELSKVTEKLFKLCDIDSEALSSLLDYLCAGSGEAFRESGEQRNGHFNTKEDLADSLEIDACFDFLTVYSSGKININTAEAPVIQSLSAGIDEEVAWAIIDYRTETPFRNVSQLAGVPGVTPRILKDVKKVATVRSSFFTVKSTGSLGESHRTVLAVIKRTKKGLDTVYWKSGI